MSYYHTYLYCGNKIQNIHNHTYLADRTGLEPATSGVTGRHSNQLNYRSVCRLSVNHTWDMVGGTGIEPVTLAL